MKLSMPGGSPCPSGSDHWRAGCWETSKPCSGRGRRSRTPTGTSPAAYFTLETSGGSDPLAEFNRAIRPGALWRKGSFGTHSAEGSRVAETMMTVVATLKQQPRHLLAYVTAACEAALCGHPAPSLLPTRADIEQGMRPAA